MTSRLPRGLKKRLEASLESLTPREAGRLYLIYLLEAYRKSYKDPLRYPPITELGAAWEARVEKARGTPRELQEVRAYNGFALLSGVIAEANIAAERDLFRLLLFAFTAVDAVEDSLRVDYMSTVARLTVDLLDELPKPASREEYDMLTAFAESEQVLPLSEAAYGLAWELTEDMGGVEIEVARREAELTAEELTDYAVDELADLITEELADLVADEFLRLLESWVKGGNWGGLAAGPWNCYSLVPIVEGTIPAWAALRAIWPPWLRDHGFLIRERPIIDHEALDGLMAAYDLDGDLEGDRLVAVVADFVADCRSRPWGAGLVAEIDPAGLARFLVEQESPITYRKAPDLGRIDWEDFRSREGDESPDWQPTYAATTLDLKDRAEDLGVAPDVLNNDFVWELYYLSRTPSKDRAGRSLITHLQKGLQVSHRPFTYARKNKDELLPPGDILGVEFTTPLEERVKHLGVIVGQHVTFKRGVDILSEDYFGGLPILLADNPERLSTVEQVLRAGEEKLQTWLAKLESEKWGIDTTSLRLIKPEADEAQARRWAGDVVEIAKRRIQFEKELFDLGDDPRGGAK